MSQDTITITPFFITFDVIGNCIDIQAIYDYVKSAYKKEVFVLNANDFVENSGRHSSKSEKSGKHRHDNSRSVARGLKQRIDSDLPKLIDNKKKFLASVERHKSAVAAGKQHKKSSRHSEDTPKFEGKIDVIYIIINYPYLPKQLSSLLDGGIKLDAFIAFTHPDGPIMCTEEILKTGRSTDSRKAQKKATIHGFELDYTNNPSSYPPTRWQALQPTAPVNVSFLEIPIGKTIEATFNSVIEQILKIEKSKKEFSEFLTGRVFKPINVSKNEHNLQPFNDFLEDNPGNFIDALYVQLKAGKWKNVPIPPKPTLAEEYKETFKNSLEEADRRVIIFPPKDPLDLIFKSQLIPSVYEVLYPLINWKLKPENAYACKSWATFINNLNNLHAYAGQKFDLLFSRINKNYKFGLPLQFYDWQQWSYTVEHGDVSEVLADAIEDSGFIDTYLDETVGILFVMTMKPITRTIGSFVPNIYMPLTMQSTSDWLNNLYETSEQPAKKSRNPITPASVAHTGQNLYQLLPTLTHRFEQRDKTIYRLPIDFTNSEEFITPYFFDTKMYVQIIRNCIHSQMTFNFKAFIGDNFELISSENSISIQPAENISFLITFPFTGSIFFNQQSMCYDGKKLTMQTAKEFPIIITNSGDLIFVKPQETPLILKQNGTIGQMLKPHEWTYVDKDCEMYVISDNKKVTKIPNKHSSTFDVSTRETTIIRPDGFEYVITKNNERRILFRNEISVIQSDFKVDYDIPSFPMMQWENNGISLVIDKFQVKMTSDSYEISCEEFTVKASEGAVEIKYGENEVYITFHTAEFKSGNNVLFASSDGVERKGELIQEIPPKKKIDFIETHWGKLIPIKETLTEVQQMELHRMYPPKFFAIRKNLSATQFFRPDVIHLEDYRQYHRTVPHSSGDSVNIVTYHKEDQIPYLFIENNTLSKLDRANKLKSVQIARPPKKKSKDQDQNSLYSQEVIEEAIACISALNTDAKLFESILTKSLTRAQDSYIDDITPPPEPPEEVIMVPPPTPQPRLLNMQHNLYDRQNDNYWKCNESEFGYPLEEKRVPGTPLSPRTKLFDPPRFFKTPKSSKVTTDPNAFVTQKLSTVVYPEENKNIVRPKSAQLSRNTIRFGKVFVGEKKIGEIVIKNTGMRPLRFNFSQIPNKSVRVLTIPGMITPGLTITVKVELDAKVVEEISTFFEFRTPLFSTKVSVTASVVMPQNTIPIKSSEEEEEEEEESQDIL
ncbi:hypothetical protein TRFO_30745 [Tritrichomonas foetus]|uniref:HYDIN/VesB/CFA65-like Ig-like domain-containing protein n=1 Tax=Tritrichomonas foetus TaxID=1144522 RepID=A0A1J4JXH2_9EUKA|nr:hypothetical protein TRFO_30745 [Tritrichomonas foetus]|eukprot:OHT02228.1 hypothetical protein TRFO_30745 [Tritrichomonas foetus]